MTDDEPAAPDPEAMVLSWPIEIRQRLARHFTPDALNRARIAERDAILFRLALDVRGTQRGVAKAIYVAIEKYRRASWRFEKDAPPADDPRRALIWRLLNITGGEVPKPGAIRAVLAKCTAFGFPRIAVLDASRKSGTAG